MLQNQKIKSICIYCGSRDGNAPQYKDKAYEVGQILAQKGITLIYGGSRTGVMGAVAQGALDAHGKVIGIIPKVIFQHEIEHKGLTELHYVDSMHTRKMKMMELADAFIALPGGFGTLDELNEIITWSQIGLHQKPIAIFNQNQFYDLFLNFLNHATTTGFVSKKDFDNLIVDSDFQNLLQKLNL